jgi:DNA primase
MAVDFDHIRKSVPILAVAERLGLNPRFNRCRCMFPENHAHGDRTPSLSFNGRTNHFKCWVCPSVKGSVLDLVMLCRDVDVMGAVAYLEGEGFLAARTAGRRTGPPPAGSRAPGPAATATAAAPASEKHRLRIFRALFELCDEVSGKSQQYLVRRKIFSRTVKKTGLKVIADYAGVSGRLKSRFSPEDLVQTGLFNDRGHLRFFKHVLLIPYLRRGRIYYFQARAVDPGVRPKELNPRGPVPFPYNADAVRKGGIIYLCEGIIDTLTLIENGFPAVGIPGALNFKPEWARLFKGKKVYSVLDADAAGRAGNEKLTALFRENGTFFRVIDMPEGRDINEMFTG